MSPDSLASPPAPLHAVSALRPPWEPPPAEPPQSLGEPEGLFLPEGEALTRAPEQGRSPQTGQAERAEPQHWGGRVRMLPSRRPRTPDPGAWVCVPARPLLPPLQSWVDICISE